MKKLNQLSGMPQMSAAFNGWEQKILLRKVNQSINSDGYVVDVSTFISFFGTIQPLKTEDIQLKPEGQRSFEWLQIHERLGAKAGPIILMINDLIEIDSTLYKVMSKNDYSRNNYIEYHIIRDYQ